MAFSTLAGSKQHVTNPDRAGKVMLVLSAEPWLVKALAEIPPKTHNDGLGAPAVF